VTLWYWLWGKNCWRDIERKVLSNCC